MELSEAIALRRSVRKFNSLDIKKEDLMTILDHGRFAPSACNLQPWHFIVLKGSALHEVYEMMMHRILKGDVDEKAEPTARTISRANALILVFNLEPQEDLISMEQSIGAAMENMTLTATSLGIGSVWIRMTSIIEEELKDKFKGKGRLSACLALGYYDRLPERRPRRKLEEITEWYL